MRSSVHARLWGVAALLLLTAISGCARIGNVGTRTLRSIQIAAANPTIAAGTAARLEVVALYCDGSRREAATGVTWVSSNASVASVDPNSGRVQGETAGTVTITARLHRASVSTILTVTPARLVSVRIAAPDASLPAGTSAQLTLTAVFSDDTSQDVTSQARWSSTDSKVVAINQNATVQGASAGSASVSARFAGQHATATLVVARHGLY